MKYEQAVIFSILFLMIKNCRFIIEEEPISDESEMTVEKVTTMSTTLTKASETLVETVQKGKLSEALKEDIQSVAVALPEIPPKDQRSKENHLLSAYHRLCVYKYSTRNYERNSNALRFNEARTTKKFSLLL